MSDIFKIMKKHVFSAGRVEISKLCRFPRSLSGFTGCLGMVQNGSSNACDYNVKIPRGRIGMLEHIALGLPFCTMPRHPMNLFGMQ